MTNLYGYPGAVYANGGLPYPGGVGGFPGGVGGFPGGVGGYPGGVGGYPGGGFGYPGGGFGRQFVCDHPRARGGGTTGPGPNLPPGQGTDTQPPTVIIQSPGSLETFEPGDIFVQATVTDDSGPTGISQVVLSVDGADTPPVQPPAGGGSTYNLSTTVMAPGQHTLTVRATDATGKSGEASVDIIIEEDPAANDTESPVVTIDPPIGDPNDSPMNFVVTGSVSDNVLVAEIAVLVDGQTNGSPQPIDQQTSQFSIPLNPPLTPGPHEIIVMARDPANNRGQDTLNVTVKDPNALPPQQPPLNPPGGGLVPPQGGTKQHGEACLTPRECQQGMFCANDNRTAGSYCTLECANVATCPNAAACLPAPTPDNPNLQLCGPPGSANDAGGGAGGCVVTGDRAAGAQGILIALGLLFAFARTRRRRADG